MENTKPINGRWLAIRYSGLQCMCYDLFATAAAMAQSHQIIGMNFQLHHNLITHNCRQSMPGGKA